MYVSSQNAQECVFIPSESEKQNKLFHICYNMTKDCYFRLSNGQETIPGWQKGAWKTENMFRKEELDWQMVCFFFLKMKENSFLYLTNITDKSIFQLFLILM